MEEKEVPATSHGEKDRRIGSDARRIRKRPREKKGEERKRDQTDNHMLRTTRRITTGDRSATNGKHVRKE